MTTTRRLLLLSVCAGAGHVRAAQAIEAAALARGGIEVTHLDVLTLVPAWFKKAYGEWYHAARHADAAAVGAGDRLRPAPPVGAARCGRLLRGQRRDRFSPAPVSRRLFQCALLAPTLARARPLRPGDDVTVWPTLVHRSPGGTLQARIEAWVFERERNPPRTRLLARALGIDLEELGTEDRQRVMRRAALFGADAKDGRKFVLQLPGADPLALPPSDSAGRVRAVVPLQAQAHAGQRTDWTLASGARRFAGCAQWLGDEGVSVVCDIDDTIKHTQVRQRRQMLLNTFAREFIDVPGMAAWLQGLARSRPGSAFHYLSGSPLQLLPLLRAFLHGSGFPEGSIHLRTFSLSPSALLDDEATSRHKHAETAQLLADHPRRRFILVGDSGERDPEVYGAIARAQPSRIDAALIRDVTGEPADSERYRRAFRGVDSERWRLFTDPAALALRRP